MINKNCLSCGSQLTKDMRYCCENCGEPVPKKNIIDIFERGKKERLHSNQNNIWESLDQKRWVITTCKKLGINPNHPGVIQRYKQEYNSKFGIKNLL